MMTRLEKLVTRLPAAGQDLEVMMLYQDERSRLWATRAAEYVEQVTRHTHVRCTWWKLEDLFNPGVLAGAVSKAMRADIILLATPAAEGLPLPVYFWVNSWLPHRRNGSGLLVGLLGQPQKAPEAGRVRRYLEQVAHRGKMQLCNMEA